MRNLKFIHRISIIPDKLLYSILEHSPRKISNYFYFSTEELPEFKYYPISDDFGPPSLPQLINFYKYVLNLLNNQKDILHYYNSPNPETKSNSLVYILFFRMIYLKITPEKTIEPLKFFLSQFKMFRDASIFPVSYELLIIDILRGLYKSLNLGWYNPDLFDFNYWITLERLDQGNINYIIPNKLYACSTFYSKSPLSGNINVLTPETSITILKSLNITLIIRLNEQFYNSEILINSGFKHEELFFEDGSTPTQEITNKFLDLVKNNDKVLVHCKAGLGRTGTLIGCYLIFEYGFTSHEAISWIRICRPGSIVGPQQHYLINFEKSLQKIINIEKPILFNTLPINIGIPQKGIPLKSNEIFDNYKNGPKFNFKKNLILKKKDNLHNRSLLITPSSTFKKK